MTPRVTFVILALLSQTGCVAAIPLVTQLVTGTNSVAQLCSLTTLPGQTGSLCDRLPFGTAPQAPGGSIAQTTQAGSRTTIVNAAAR
jgi:hypothetical protein